MLNLKSGESLAILLQIPLIALLPLVTNFKGAYAISLESRTEKLTQDGLVEPRTAKHSNRTPRFYGGNRSSKRLTIRAPSHECRRGVPECNDSNLANRVACEALWEELHHGGFQGDYMTGDRYVCLELEGHGQCCTTWNADRPGFRGRSLADGVRQMLDKAKCQGDKISSRLWRKIRRG
jgi:hypothetical protein